jgi:hypothetical protein
MSFADARIFATAADRRRSRRRTARWLMRAALAGAFVLAGAAQAQAIRDANIVEGRARSEFEPGVGVAGHTLSLTFTQPQPEGCLWSAASSFSACPGRAGLPNLPNGSPVWAGGLQVREACGGSTTRIGDSWIGCIAYDTSPYFSVNNPASKYWVVVANDEPSFE